MDIKPPQSMIAVPRGRGGCADEQAIEPKAAELARLLRRLSLRRKRSFRVDWGALEGVAVRS